MASAPGYPKGWKSKSSLPCHYYEGYLEKKGPKDRDFKKFWAGLQGLTLYFYNNIRDPQYVEKVDLETFVSLTDDAPRTGLGGSPRDGGTWLCLSLRNQELLLKVESLEAREMWKGFILTVVEMKVPSDLTLLPGHKYMMAEALAKEEERRAHEIPHCFLKVSRLEAQLLLERYPECGNLLLRPGSDRAGISVTTRQMLNGTEVVRHYKVKQEGQLYIIDVEEPFSCSSLWAVVNYFVSNTKKALVPFQMDEDYEKVIGFVESNKENGESSWTASKSFPPPAASSPVAAKQPLKLPSLDKNPLKPPTTGPMPPSEENYVIPISEPHTQYVNEEEVAEFHRSKPSGLPPNRPNGVRTKWAAKTQEKEPPPLTRTEPKGLLSSVTPKKSGFSSSHPKFLASMGICTEMSEELERKLQLRRATLDE
ncbi:signal-transducing adaptor protein 2 [Ornithorhynchus anatinus]|uniref:signal-transducing adaptor protein 2 n=1 Tax=Ornithorhynchus anatinus TaxID=9258 RepID=UPI0010A84BD3|nr:signal-transducing adaptor protein 2 [Ornithorhynchus anatinus]